jgi:hypothetical protein
VKTIHDSQTAILYLITLRMLISAGVVQAQESNDELAKAAQNPLANLMSFPFQNNTNFNYGPEGDRTQILLNIQPVIPLIGGRIITRTILPLLWQPEFTTENNVSAFGLADINFTAFYSPPSKSVTWGIGPILTIPTGYKYSSGKWGLGPSFVILVSQPKMVYGLLINNVWSIAGNSERSDINHMLLQPFFNYNFSDGAYIGSIPIITSNWQEESGQQWTIPLGLSAGKIVRFGMLPVNLQAGAYVNVVKPDIGPDWQLRLQMQLLMPTSIFQAGKNR